MDAELQQLLAAWLGNDVDESALNPILERLKADSEFRDEFVREISMLGQLKAVQSSYPRWLELEDVLATPIVGESSDEELESQVMSSIANESVIRPIANESPAFPFAKVIAGLAAAATFVFCVWWWNGRTDSDGHTPNRIARQLDTPDSRTDTIRRINPVAVLSQSVDANWDGEWRPAQGDSLGRGDLKLLSGTVQIDFLSGVRVLLRGPADLELLAVDEILLREGAASCFVTEMGRGFRIATDEMEVIDVGTAFSIDVHRDRESEVHVLEGSVEIKSPKRELIELRERHAIRMSDTGPIDVAYSPDRFPQPASLREQQRDYGDKRYAAWQQHVRKLDTDPAVLLHYTFDEAQWVSPTDGTRQVGGQSHRVELFNHASGAGKASDGAVIGCDWTEGRWPSKSALLYRNADDRVLFQVPGAYESLTFMAWIRIDALTQPITSLMMTEAPSRRRRFTSTEFQIARDAVRRRSTSTVQSVRWELNQQQSNVLFSIGYGNGPPREWRYEKVPAPNAAMNADLWGKWILVGVTCDTKRHQVFHYLNGAEIGRGELASDAPLLLDFMELGNFGISTDELERSAGRSQRRFYGAIDEVVIAGRVFTPAEMRSTWEIGQP